MSRRCSLRRFFGFAKVALGALFGFAQKIFPRRSNRRSISGSMAFDCSARVVRAGQNIVSWVALFDSAAGWMGATKAAGKRIAAEVQTRHAFPGSVPPRERIPDDAVDRAPVLRNQLEPTPGPFLREVDSTEEQPGYQMADPIRNRLVRLSTRAPFRWRRGCRSWSTRRAPPPAPFDADLQGVLRHLEGGELEPVAGAA